MEFLHRYRVQFILRISSLVYTFIYSSIETIRYIEHRLNKVFYGSKQLNSLVTKIIPLSILNNSPATEVFCHSFLYFIYRSILIFRMMFYIIIVYDLSFSRRMYKQVYIMPSFMILNTFPSTLSKDNITYSVSS